MAAASVRTVAVVDWLTLIPILPPSSQTLTDVSPRACLYTFSLQGAECSTGSSEETDCVFYSYTIKTGDLRSGCSHLGGVEHTGQMPHR